MLFMEYSQIIVFVPFGYVRYGDKLLVASYL